MTDSKNVGNKLQDEQSPYLLQHAHNPVDWYPWGEDAFAKSRLEDKPIFLSIGYSTCHWCHVMAHESFEDQEVADLLNAHFVAIKVDREERPDIDAVYMTACQAMTGHGGWPLTIFMTPEQKPFLAGTYFPKESRQGSPSLMAYLKLIWKKWAEDKAQILDIGDEMVAVLEQQEQGAIQGRGPSLDLIQEGFRGFRQSFDWTYGGFGSSPKFPSAHQLLFLMRYSHVSGDLEALAMAEKTLVQMARGGIFDHLGGGFSRYATDQRWLVPHFEKMLYDNALLAMAYTEAYQITGKDIYTDVAKRTLDYVLREMRDGSGGFYSAQDADSEGEEGKYYVFTQEELLALLGSEDGAYFNDYYQVIAGGNFEGKTILNRLPDQDLLRPERIVQLTEKVSSYRLSRMALHKDDKILTAWNGLMIAALAKAGQVFGEPLYLEAARGGMAFVEAHLMDQDGKLMVRYRDGHRMGQGHLDDYAFVIWALLELYEATYEVDFLDNALALNDHLLRDFWDEEAGGFTMNGQGANQLIYNPKQWYDGAMPSGNSVMALNLLKLAKYTGQADLQSLAEAQLQAAANQGGGTGFSFLLMALTYALYPTREIVYVSKSGEKPRWALKGYHPNTVVLVKTLENAERLEKLAPFTASYEFGEKPWAYICQNHTCSAPISDEDILGAMVGEGRF